MAIARRLILVAALAALALVAAPSSTGSAVAAPVAKNGVPTLAYYYIWYNASSWNRAKRDYPVIGRYSSDEPSVMRRHIRWAKDAGLTGFIVSWKSTEVLNRRLALLARIAEQERFGLTVIYQGLDFARDPLPPTRVRDDLQFFARRFAPMAAFEVFERPVVIISGTWEFTPSQIASITAPVRDELLVLGSERNTEGIERLAPFLDGDAYYWSSADPRTTPGYDQKLTEMAEAVHRTGGLWIAPAAAGFDARMIGGERVIERDGGATLRAGMNAAVASSPDAIGVISWNEFSENSHIEPSEGHGDQSLATLADVLGSEFSVSGEFDSSNPGGRSQSPGWAAAGMLLLVFGGTALLAIRRRSTHAARSDVV
ncbi:MAG: hypothetical protein OER93_07390, partial [Thermoleophilia bacterium]|nr:hypothetical protein [Thermoleophilia bacterium]